jgi:hypothetical protein
MYEIETSILLRVLGISKRTLYNFSHGYYGYRMKYHPPVISDGEMFICMINGKQVRFITQRGVEQILESEGK